jgi:endonuclease/exonuclease/phosphatase family metal-dependent hydrolase
MNSVNSGLSILKHILQGLVLGGVILCVSCGSSQDSSSSTQKDTYYINTIAFYNLENLFDAEDDPQKFDEASPIMEIAEGEREAIYNQKVTNMAKAIADIGADAAGIPPAILGVCEVENFKVLQDVVNTAPLSTYNYGIIHYNSPDARGIDVALLYQKTVFRPMHSKPHELVLYSDSDSEKRKYTRDQLYVKGKLDGEELHIIVNHWPSRSGGEKRSQPYRIKAAQLTKNLKDSIQIQDPYAKIFIMGDFNDGPYNESIKMVLGTKAKTQELSMTDLYNPFEKLQKQGIGTIAWRDTWDVFDMILLSKPLIQPVDKDSYSFYQAHIFNPFYLQNPKGRFKGYPYRSFSDGGFSGGFSDHFPVYLYVIKKKHHQ